MASSKSLPYWAGIWILDERREVDLRVNASQVDWAILLELVIGARDVLVLMNCGKNGVERGGGVRVDRVVALLEKVSWPSTDAVILKVVARDVSFVERA